MSSNAKGKKSNPKGKRVNKRPSAAVDPVLKKKPPQPVTKPVTRQVNAALDPLGTTSMPLSASLAPLEITSGGDDWVSMDLGEDDQYHVHHHGPADGSKFFWAMATGPAETPPVHVKIWFDDRGHISATQEDGGSLTPVSTRLLTPSINLVDITDGVITFTISYPTPPAPPAYVALHYSTSVDGGPPSVWPCSHGADNEVSFPAEGSFLVITAWATDTTNTLEQSRIATAVYGWVEAPSIIPPTGTYDTPCAVTVESSTPGASIQTSTDDGATWSSPVPTPSNITLTIPPDGVTLKAKATRAGMTDSTETSVHYSLRGSSDWNIVRREQVVGGSWTDVESYSGGITESGDQTAYHLDILTGSGERGAKTHWKRTFSGSGTCSLFDATAEWNASTGYPYGAIYMYHKNAAGDVIWGWSTGEHTNGSHGSSHAAFDYDDGDYLEVILQSYLVDGTLTNTLEITAP